MSAPRINLNVIDIPNPCAMPWDEMTGDERVRFCGKCQKNVYHLSHMTREEAERLIAEKEGGLCVQFYRRADGSVVTRDCTVVAVAKKAGNAFWLVACSFAAAFTFVVFGRQLDWFGGSGNQTFSCVGGGIVPHRASSTPTEPAPIQPAP